jgi:hypothetical protein
MRRQRSARFPAAWARCFSVLRAITGDCGDAQLGGFFDGPLHAIELVDGHHQSNRQRGVGIEFGNKVEAYFARFSIQGDRGNLSMKDAAAGHNIRFHVPGSARSTRAKCSACAPSIVAVASSQCSAIQRRRVIVQVLSSSKVYGVARGFAQSKFCRMGLHRRAQSGF